MIWRPLFDHFASRFRLLCWDYRGLFGSGPAPDPAAYSFAHHLRDLVFLIERERLQSPLLVGWSMGVQVCLELHRTHPDQARAVIAIHGNHGLPLKTAFDS